jgi:hypothetical protein
VCQVGDWEEYELRDCPEGREDGCEGTEQGDEGPAQVVEDC